LKRGIIMSSAPRQQKKTRQLLIASLIINIALASGLTYGIWNATILQSHLQRAILDGEKLNNNLFTLRQEHELLQRQLEYYKQQAEYYSRVASSGQTGSEVMGRSSISIVAVSQVESGLFQTSYVGAVMTAEVELRKGEGRLLVNTIPRVGIDLQTSGRTAVLVAQNITGIFLQRTDVVLTVKAKKQVEVVDGPSAGAVMTLAVISAIWNHTLNKNTYMTGTVKPDGTIGEVGGITYKALAAAQEGAIAFIVPKGQSIVTMMVARESHPVPGLTFITYEPVQVKLSDYLKEKGHNMRVVEVTSIMEAYNMFRQT